MIKRLRPMLILAGAALVLGILLWVLVAFVLPKDEAGDEKGNSVVLLDTQLTDADSIEIKNNFDSYTLVKHSVGTYYVEGKEGYSVNSESVTGLLKNVGSLTASKKVIDQPNEEQLESYGLKNPHGTLKIKKGDEVYSFKIGTTSATGNYYLQMQEEPTVYLIPAAVPDVALLARYQFYQNTMIDYSEDNASMETLKKFEISGEKVDEHLVIEMNVLEEDEVGTSFILTAPFRHSLSSAMQDKMLDLLNTLSTASVVGDDTGAESLKKYGLDQPAYTFSFTMKNKVQTVHFGKVNEAGNQYCYTEGDKFIHSVTEDSAKFLGNSIKDYCEDMIYTRSADTLSAIRVTGNGKTYQINIGEQDDLGNFHVTINNKVVDSELFSDFYSHILIIGITDMGDKGTETELRVTVEITLKDGTKETMRFYPVSELKCFYEINGAGRFWVSTLNVDKILDNAQKLYDGEVIMTEW